MSSDIAIRVQNITKTYQIYDKPQDRLKQSLWRGRKQFYREFKALDDVSFEVKKGETVGIIGRNGSGKSTLLQIVCGTLTPTLGEIDVNGRTAALLELGAGFNPEFTGRENVYMNASILGLSKHEIDSRFDSILDFADIGEFVDQPVKTYSSGMFMRLAFAVIANVDADILIIDEALAVGDFRFVQKCMRFLREFKKSGTILFVSHDMAAVASLCDSALWLHQGKIYGHGIAKDICESYLAFSYEEGSDSEVGRCEWAEDNAASQSYVSDGRAVEREGDNKRSFGSYKGLIVNVRLVAMDGRSISSIRGGENVSLEFDVIAPVNISRPIFGFVVKDRLGQALFGDNTESLMGVSPITEGEVVRAMFSFVMPYLKQGEYSVDVAVAESVKGHHEIIEWKHDELVFDSLVDSLATGLVGISVNKKIKRI